MQYPSFTSFKIAIIICIVTIIWIFSWLLMKKFIKNGQKSIPQSNQSIFIRKADVFVLLSQDNKTACHICLAANMKDK